MGLAETAPTDCAPCLFWQTGTARVAGGCVFAGAGSCRPHIACTLRLKAPPDVSAAAASSSLRAWSRVSDRTLIALHVRATSSRHQC